MTTKGHELCPVLPTRFLFAELADQYCPGSYSVHMNPNVDLFSQNNACSLGTGTPEGKTRATKLKLDLKFSAQFSVLSVASKRPKPLIFFRVLVRTLATILIWCCKGNSALKFWIENCLEMQSTYQ